jgi:hypothetical protein
VSWDVNGVDVQTILKQVEELPAQAGSLPAEVERVGGRLLSMVETLSSDRLELTQEVNLLSWQLERKRSPRLPIRRSLHDDQGMKNATDHSSEKRWRQRSGDRPRHRDQASQHSLSTKCLLLGE